MNRPWNRVPVAVLGSTGLVGQQFVRMLEDHPYFELVALAASSRSAGKSYAEAASWLAGGEVPSGARRLTVIEGARPAVLGAGARVVFSALPRAAAEPLEAELRSAGCFVFSNAASHRLDPDVPLLVAEVNASHLDLARSQVARHGGAIVTNSNCSTSGLALALGPLRPLGLAAATVTTFQAISGAGRRGLASLEILGNVIPFIRDEEPKMLRETQKILGRVDDGRVRPSGLEVEATCCRVPVRDGHLLSLRLELETQVTADEVREAYEAFRGLPQEMGLPSAPARPVLVRLEDDRPQPALDSLMGSPWRARGMAVTVGRIRASGRTLRLVALVHNTIRGAAGSCLLNAELAYRQGLFGPMQPDTLGLPLAQ